MSLDESNRLLLGEKRRIDGKGEGKMVFWALALIFSILLMLASYGTFAFIVLRGIGRIFS